MADPFDVRAVQGRAPGDSFDRRLDEAMRLNESVRAAPASDLDGPQARKVHQQLLQWYWHERDRQSANRLEMAMDADFYDGLQWDPEDAALVAERGQAPLVFNEVAPMIDWLIGTERRARVDWRVLPRTEDDVQMADVKTKVLKYVSDINRVTFNRSRAFADAVKVGVGWLDDGVRDDPTSDVLYSTYEDWRRVLWDSASYEPGLEDARYVFRWRWVDRDVAEAMFPGRVQQVGSAIEDAAHNGVDEDEEETWYGPEERARLTGRETAYTGRFGTGSVGEGSRERVRLIEAQYRMPVKSRIVTSGPLRGAFVDPRDTALMQALQSQGGSVVQKIAMRVHVAVFTETDMLAMGPSVFRHNRFSLTPVWCYRRGSDRLPYGAIRRVRDIQADLNKRASKALWMLNTNQIIAEEGATEDWNTVRDEADRPDGVIITKAGKRIEIRRDTDAATGQIQMMSMDAQSIQKSAGVSQENLGRQTNAVSGEAIKARQIQGSVVTTEPFDNLRLATQIQGEKQLSLSEQFFTEPKVVRLTGAKGALDWVKINQPEQQADGSVRYLNDMAASMADFVVSEADYAGTLRQVMFDSLNQIASRLPPEVALRLLTIAYEFSDLPNKGEIAEAIRRMTGERDPSKEMSPQEAQQAEQQAQAQIEAMEMQRQQARLALEEQAAKVRELNARAAKLEAESDAGAGGPGDAEIGAVRAQAAGEIERVSEELRKLQQQQAADMLKINRQADTAIEVARINAAASRDVAEIQAESRERIAELSRRLDSIEAERRPAPPPPAA